jgi:hypothetical protein
MSLDFVARAGAAIDRAHRVAGLLLIFCVLLTILTMCQINKNAELNRQLATITQRLPVIVVPGAVPGKYDPREDTLLVSGFVDKIVQAFNTFTPVNLGKQLQSVEPFLAPALLVDSRNYFTKKLKDAEALKRASLFVPDRTTLKIRPYTQNGQEMRDVTLQGTLQNFAAGTLAESLQLEITLTLQKTVINPDINPYGFLLVRYQERSLVDPNLLPQSTVIDTSGPTGGER